MATEGMVLSSSLAAYKFAGRAVRQAHVAVEKIVSWSKPSPERAAKRRLLQIFTALGAKRAEIVDKWGRSQFDPERLSRAGVGITEFPSRDTVVRSFLVPLFELLRAWLKTGEERFAAVYLDERLRYAPHLADPAVRYEFFLEVLALDEAAIVRALPDPHARATVTELLNVLHAPLRAPPAARPFRLMALGDCLMNEVRVALCGRSRADGHPLDFRELYFSARRRGLSAEAPLTLLRDFPADLVSASFMTYNGIAPYRLLMSEAGGCKASEIERRVETILKIVGDFLQLLREHTNAPFLIHNASGLPIRGVRRFSSILTPLSHAQQEVLRLLNAGVAELVSHTPKVILLDEAAVAQQRGLRACTERLIPRSLAPQAEFHTRRFGEYLMDAYLDVISSYQALSKCKALVVDLDNALWHGVREHGPVEHHLALQRLLRRVREAGILLIATSWNGLHNVRWNEMALGPGDFVLQKVGRQPKVSCLEEASEQLNLGLDSFVLLESIPMERELVRSQFPQIHALDPGAPHTTAWIERMLAFPNAGETAEAKQRTELYRQQMARKSAFAPELDYPAMMAGLKLAVRFRTAHVHDLERIVELAQRTNQFNTATIRWSKQQLTDFLEDRDRGLYTASLADKFGDLGLVVFAMVRRSGTDRVIESFAMSCRAMGLGLERLVLRLILDSESGPERRFVGRYIATKRNTPASRLYEEAGFVRGSEQDWVLEPGAARPKSPPWFAVTIPSK